MMFHMRADEGSVLTNASMQPAGRRRRARVVAALLGSVVLAGCLAAVAVAGATGTVRSAYSKELGARVAANAQGLTLYALRPETSRHLLCKSRTCLSVWPPLTVRSRRAHLSRGTGVRGRLGLIARGHGVFQVTLNGMPLYRFRYDKKTGQSYGQGIRDFGGVWHAVLASGKASTKVPHYGIPEVKLPPYKPPVYPSPPPINPQPIY
jgi:predicted lipoprotein with Yx(FWY)xxD motif